MKQYSRIIFLDRSGTCRAPMAAAIFRESFSAEEIEVLSRGLVVAFPEPMNQKAEAVLISNGIDIGHVTSVQISEEDIREDTLVFALETAHKEKLLRLMPGVNANQVWVLTEFVGDELEIIDPYGGTLTAYGLCYESLKKTLKKLVNILNEGE